MAIVRSFLCQHRVTLSLVSMSWLITIFADVLPAQTTVRVFHRL
jgi:hypothetical protein